MCPHRFHLVPALGSVASVATGAGIYAIAMAPESTWHWQVLGATVGLAAVGGLLIAVGMIVGGVTVSAAFRYVNDLGDNELGRQAAMRRRPRERSRFMNSSSVASRASLPTMTSQTARSR
ncbi:hypothetical protein Pan216_23130 [Planctomycetes bacterium Pan216]|uniref:Uncharacterized protein n=1 Tax=Kolteria novifilia TaxID=2527975 RepID=A0A518B3D8_9BACT|nr:hypothetical protein Pan216_23130 [Planctomycetes bacterium Pan216]